MTIDIHACTPTDLDALLAFDGRRGAQEAVRWRYEQQQRDEAVFLVAWRDETLAGRTSLTWWSKYDQVRHALGDFPEINGLDAWPQNHGTGTLIVAECERIARDERGSDRIGLAVELGNPNAKRLYERLGFVDWGRGEIVDEWIEKDESGNVAEVHRPSCNYLTRALT
ncbi:MAG: hypothetical protein QOF21_396 [Actinomycetota bacterium]